MNAAKLDMLIAREQERFLKLHPRSARAWEEGKQHFLYGGPSHWMRRWAGGFPWYVEEANGAHIRDIDGHDYVDFCLGDTGGMCGHAPEAITRAALRQLSRGATMMLPTEDSLWVGAELSRRFGPRYWTLTTSATDDQPRRDPHRANDHGAAESPGVLRLLSRRHRGGPYRDPRRPRRHAQPIDPNGVDHAAVSRIVEFNDVEGLERALSHGDVACVLAEPLMTNFGMIPVAPGFHEALRDITRRTGTVLIIDETHTLSCGPGGFTQLHGLEPDILVAGKAIAGGIPAGIFGLNAEIAERMWKLVPLANPRQRQAAHLGIGGTLAGNALTVATMRAVLESVLTAENYQRMIANATRLAGQSAASSPTSVCPGMSPRSAPAPRSCSCRSRRETVPT
ncbi:aminotransferase class III-fold pyridoxal phosphate-dependent enzyme [Bradyrhizobium sp. 157]|uniref:aminotransferase class III-fold pyridoxal phosphate-dependent enzyme n=1 Tax=Bradyrhizobium sp. 157 TaxID=2782631 RepID=UPI001FFC1A8E|nr:aminotransferase class III-fold pyridoxal phosphate-dependent enzyme [Bradyrhizobium sp. 157]